MCRLIVASGRVPTYLGVKLATNLKDRPVSELLGLHVALLEALRERGVLRSENNVTAELADYLFCAAYGWRRPSSETRFNAISEDDRRYRIKGRRLTIGNPSRQLSAIRDHGFDVLAAVLFDDLYSVARAALIPVDIVRRRSTHVRHTNSDRFMLQDDVWIEPGVVDVTDRLRQTLSQY